MGQLTKIMEPAATDEVLARFEAQDAKIAMLQLQLLAMQKRDIQTLNGKSSRRDWLAAHPEHTEWAQSLAALQEANALAMLPRPADAERQVLYNAAEANQLDVVVSSIALGYNPNREEELHPKFGTTPLMEAAFHGHDDIVKLLIEQNAQLNTQSGFGWTALHYAGQNQQLGSIALLVAAGCNRGVKNNKGKTAQTRALGQGKDTVAALIDG